MMYADRYQEEAFTHFLQNLRGAGAVMAQLSRMIGSSSTRLLADADQYEFGGFSIDRFSITEHEFDLDRGEVADRLSEANSRIQIARAFLRDIERR